MCECVRVHVHVCISIKGFEHDIDLRVLNFKCDSDIIIIRYSLKMFFLCVCVFKGGWGGWGWRQLISYISVMISCNMGTQIIYAVYIQIVYVSDTFSEVKPEDYKVSCYFHFQYTLVFELHAGYSFFTLRSAIKSLCVSMILDSKNLKIPQKNWNWNKITTGTIQYKEFCFYIMIAD